MVDDLGAFLSVASDLKIEGLTSTPPKQTQPSQPDQDVMPIQDVFIGAMQFLAFHVNISSQSRKNSWDIVICFRVIECA